MMPDTLETFLITHTARPWEWGVVDGAMVLADWALDRGRGDLGARWRGSYSDEMGWQGLVVARGGLLPLVNDGCDRAGLEQTDAPARGVIGVIGSARVIQQQWCAIHDGDRWLVRRPGGFAVVDAPLLGAWLV